MTREEKIRILKRYKIIDIETESLCDERKDWFEYATKINPELSDMPRANSNNDKIQLAVEKMTEIDAKLNELLCDKVEEKYKIEQAINGIDDDTTRVLLRYRFINGYTMEEVAEKMGYDLRWLYRIYKKAINQIEINP